MLYQLSFFSADDPVIAELKALDLNALSPLDALNKLYELQARATKGSQTAGRGGAKAARRSEAKKGR